MSTLIGTVFRDEVTLLAAIKQDGALVGSLFLIEAEKYDFNDLVMLVGYAHEKVRFISMENGNRWSEKALLPSGQTATLKAPRFVYTGRTGSQRLDDVDGDIERLREWIGEASKAVTGARKC